MPKGEALGSRLVEGLVLIIMPDWGAEASRKAGAMAAMGESSWDTWVEVWASPEGLGLSV